MAMLATGEGAKQKVLSELADLGLHNIYINQPALNDEIRYREPGNKSYGLTWDDVNRLKKHQYIDAIAAIKAIDNEAFGVEFDVSIKVVFASPNYLQITGKEVAQGRQLLAEDTTQNNLVCVLGSEVSKALGANGRFGKSLRLNGQPFKIVGVLENAEKSRSETKEIARDNVDEMVFLSFPSSFLNKDDALQATTEKQLTRIIVKVADKVDVIAASRAIDRSLYINHHKVRDYSMVVPRELLNQSLKTQAVFNLFLSVTGGISLFVGGIGIMNIMLANVSERKREIGIRRAVGATKYHIALQFLTESVLLTLVGAIVGLFLGYISVFLIEQIAGWPVQVTLLSLVLPFGLAVSAGLFFGLYPAIRAASLEPINALKSL